MRQPLRTIGQPPFAAGQLGHLAGQRAPRHAVVLDQLGELQAGVQHRGDDLADAVVPGCGGVVHELNIGLDVGRRIGPEHRLRGFEVREPQRQQVGPLVVDRPQRRVAVPDEQPAAGGQQLGDQRTPARDVGQPADRADPGVHQVEPAGAQHVHRVVQVGLDEVDVRVGALGQRARFGQRRCREVQRGHPGTEPVQRQGVRPDVALQVHAALAGQVTEPVLVEAHHVAEEVRLGQEALHRVARRGGVRRGPLVPVGLVQAAIVIGHRCSLASGASDLTRDRRRPAGPARNRRCAAPARRRCRPATWSGCSG